MRSVARDGDDTYRVVTAHWIGSISRPDCKGLMRQSSLASPFRSETGFLKASYCPHREQSLSAGDRWYAGDYRSRAQL
jgi:hypothetical protein